MDDWNRRTDATPLAALIVADAGDEADAQAAARSAGARIAATIGWSAAIDELAVPDDIGVLLIEAAAADPATLALALPVLARTIRARGLQAIVALDESQIDPVAAELLGEGVQLLCLPTLADRILALAIAAEVGLVPGRLDRIREGEGERIARLNAEIARIAELLARLGRQEDDGGASLADRRPAFDAGPGTGAEPIAAQAVRRIIRARRLRDRQFGAGLFEDPAWDMMLDLFAAHLEHAQVSVSSLCIAAAVAPTTALRWIGRLTDGALFERHPDPFDRRRAFMALSPGALAGMRAYVAAAQAQGLPIV